jgi:hypothetical protein
MASIVCIWEGSSGYGHASMFIGDYVPGYDTTFYVSWFPTEEKGDIPYAIGALPGVKSDPVNHTFPADRQHYRKLRAYEITTPLNLFGMLNYWWMYKDKLKYKAILRNCAQMVVNVLRAGGASIPRRIAWWTPAKLERWAKDNGHSKTLGVAKRQQ